MYKKEYSEPIKGLEEKLEELKNKPIPKDPSFALTISVLSGNLEPSLDVLIDVHGGITYANGNGKYPVASRGWWFGFDCAHSGDATKYLDGELRSFEYVKQECFKLVRQLQEIETILKGS